MEEVPPKKKSSSGSSGSFASLGLSPGVYQGIVRLGFRQPTPVQRKALPVILSGVDTVCMARTGSGKTAAFLIPLLEKLSNEKEQSSTAAFHTTTRGVRGVILSPTRELSSQTLRVLHKMAAAGCNVKAVGIHGGEGMERQFDSLASRPDVIVATPGRLAHHVTEIPDFSLRECQMCILDEADRLLEMGFAQQIRMIARSLPESCQKVLLSATMPKVLVEFTKGGFCVDPSVVRLDNEASVSAELRISFVTCRSMEKDAALLHIMQYIQDDTQAAGNNQSDKKKKFGEKEDNRSRSRNAASDGTRTGLTLIFAATRHHVEYVATLLKSAGVADVAMIYGSMDQEARKANLSEFKSGKKPVLVVTDVAARGIDVPLMDHVIHYHFPPSPKLFVHRSGRAARAGRIGFCWGLVEPDELPYMVDLHLFLGRNPTTSHGVTREAETETSSHIAYTLEEMTPDMVHYGSVPELVATSLVENIQRMFQSELCRSQDAEALNALTKVCNNAMQQYRRTRPEASREGVRRAKDILEGSKLETGQRVGRGAIPPHPLFAAAEAAALRAQEEASQNDGTTAAPRLDSADNLRQRQDFLRALSNFRPKESVFEAFATGAHNKDAGVQSHLDKGRTTGQKKHDHSVALLAMKNMRRQMRMAHDKGSSLVVAGSECARERNGDADNDEEDDSHIMPQAGSKSDMSNKATPVPKGNIQDSSIAPKSKQRMSKAERKRLKNNAQTASAAAAPSVTIPDMNKKKKNIRDFRDPAFFIDNDFSSDAAEMHRSRQVEAAMQPSSASSIKGSMGAALRLEEAMLDIVGDENDTMIKKQRMMRWDKAKRKYVQTTVGSELTGDSKSKKTRLESGQLVKNDKFKLGELYQKWQKKTNRSVGRSGVFDDADAQPAPARKMQKGTTAKDDSETKSATAIKKERDKKQQMKMKNMKKGDRRKMERQQRQGSGKQSKAANKRR